MSGLLVTAGGCQVQQIDLLGPCADAKVGAAAAAHASHVHAMYGAAVSSLYAAALPVLCSTDTIECCVGGVQAVQAAPA
jgi:hypothetical protein